MNHTSHKKSKVANAILLSLLSVTTTVTAMSALAQDNDAETPVDSQAQSAEESHRC